jgi:serine/threonine-protein kinase
VAKYPDREPRVPEVLDRLCSALADRYRLELDAEGRPATIGRGGMATVYLAEDLRHGRRVALKVIHPELTGRSYEPERFLREIRFAARLSHPQILPVHDSGEQDGFLYFVMPYAGCESLRDRLIREGTLPLAEVVRITERLAAALDYAHRAGVLHRDIKPENILLHEGEPVLADFGVARALSAAEFQSDSDTEVITASGVAVGTPAYMSPEQAAGDDELDARSDQYSLACVVYEMLTGQPPFTGMSARAIIARQAIEPVRPTRVLRPSVPAAMDDALLTALSKNPTDRYDTAGDLAAALRRGARAPAGGLDAIFAAPDRAIAVLPFANGAAGIEQEYLSDGMTDELIGVLTQVDGLRVASRTSAFAYKGIHRDVRSIGAELGVAFVLEGSLRWAGGRLRVTAMLSDVATGRTLWSERYDRASADVFAIQDEIARQIVDTLRTRLLAPVGQPVAKRYTSNVRAYQLYLQGRFAWNQRTQESFAEAIRLFEQAIAEDPQYALAYTGLADCHALSVDYRSLPVAEGMQRARIEAEHALALDDGLAEAHTSLGWVTFIHDWDWPEAGRHLRRAIELNPRYPTARQWYSWLLLAQGRTDDAIGQARLSFELDPASISIRRSYGWLLCAGHRADLAIEQLRRAAELNPAQAETHRLLGMAQIEAGAFADAEVSLRDALRYDPGDSYTLGHLGRMLVLAGRRREAEAIRGELEARREREYVSPVPLTILAIALGDTDAAFEWLERCYEERRGWLAYLRVEPILDPLRSDPRFGMLLRRLRLDT